MPDALQKIILVDDDPVNIQICRMMLSKVIAGLEFQIYEDGYEAYRALVASGKIPDEHELLFLDLNMPEMNGWEFIEEFEKADIQLKEKFSIYILTSSISELDVNRAKDFPSVRNYLVKPLNTKTVRAVLEEMEGKNIGSQS